MRNFLKAAILAVAVFACTQAFGQGARFDNFTWTTSQIGASGVTSIVPVPGATITVCSSPAVVVNGVCTNKATTYTDATLATPCGASTQVVLQNTSSCVATSDSQGNFGFWVAPGVYTYTISGASITAQGPYSITVPINAASSQTGTFTNTQQNDFVSMLLNGIVPSTRFSTQQGGNFATEALVGGVNCTGTVHQCNGVAGYVQSTSTTPFPVALYGQAEIGIASGKAYGFNTVSADTASLSGTVVGGEVDINVANAISTVVGYSLQGAWAAQPTSANAFNFGAPSGGFHWQNGLVFNGGFTNNTCAGGGSCAAITLNQSSTGASQDSQQIIFNSNSKSASFRLRDSDGNLFSSVPYVSSGFISTSANPSLTGQVRLGSTEAIGFRNNANSGDLLIGHNASDQITIPSSINSPLYATSTNCSSAGGACSVAPAGSVVVAAGATTVTVATTAVTANSQILLTRDNSLGTKLSVTCNTQSSLVLGTPYVSARTAATSFVITIDVAPTTNPMCISYSVIN